LAYYNAGAMHCCTFKSRRIGSWGWLFNKDSLCAVCWKWSAHYVLYEYFL
jgi:hypothetical protein